MNTKRIALRRGFTLLEVLVVTAILAIVVAAIGACLAAGMRVWEAARKYGRGEPEAALACALMERDLVNAFPFYAVPFSGTVDSVSMPALARSGAPEDAEVRRIGTVRYYRSRERGAWMRKSWTFPSPEPADGAAETLAAAVRGLQFRYAAPGDTADAWREAWTDPSNLPWKVRIEVELADDAGGYRIDRTVVRPATNGAAG